MERIFEQKWPFAVALLLTLLAMLMPQKMRVEMVKDLGSAILNIFAIMVGFIATALVLLVTARDMETIRRLRQTVQYNGLIGFHWSAISLGLAAALVSLLAIVLCKSDNPSLVSLVVFHLWLLLCAWATGAFYRVVHLLRIILEAPYDA